MSRYWYALLGALLLVLMIGGGMYYVNKVTNEMETLVKEVQDQLEQGNQTQAKEMLRDSNSLWEQKRMKLEAMLDHTSLEQISISLSEAKAFLQYGKIDHCAALCQTVLQTLRALREDQLIGLHNLF